MFFPKITLGRYCERLGSWLGYPGYYQLSQTTFS